jgi:hypothetical protein
LNLSTVAPETARCSQNAHRAKRPDVVSGRARCWGRSRDGQASAEVEGRLSHPKAAEAALRELSAAVDGGRYVERSTTTVGEYSDPDRPPSVHHPGHGPDRVPPAESGRVPPRRRRPRPAGHGHRRPGSPAQRAVPRSANREILVAGVAPRARRTPPGTAHLTDSLRQAGEWISEPTAVGMTLVEVPAA